MAMDAVQFVSVFHGGAADEDDGVGTPEGFQDTPDQWHSARQRKRGVGDALADAATQRDSQATQVQSVATEAQSFDPEAALPGASPAWPKGPSFVDATGSISGDSDRHVEDVDEDETQIVMSFSQDHEALRNTTSRIQEEELERAPAPQCATSDDATGDGDASDADSDMSDDMLEQDGDVNVLSSIAKSFELQEAETQQEKKPPTNVYKPRVALQITPPASVADDANMENESSGAETEVEEEPQASETGRNELVKPPPPALTVSVKKGFLGKRSVSENEVNLSQEIPPRRLSLDRSASCDDSYASPERTRRARVLLGASSEGKPPLSRANRLRLDSADQNTADASEATLTGQASIPSSQETDKVTEALEGNTPVIGDQALSEMAAPVQSKALKLTPAPATKKNPTQMTPKSIKKRKTASQARIEDTEAVEDNHGGASQFKESATTSCPSIRVMFTGLDGTIPKLRDKVQKIADACQEDDDVEKVTHLVAPKNQLKRTVKLLCGISCCDHILDERWLDESARSGVCASEALHCLKDTNAEAKWNFSLYNTMYNIPKEQRRQLFRGLRFFITNHKSILPPVKELVKIVECAGGEAVVKGAATETDIVITSEAALGLAATKKATATASPDRIYSPEIILSSILQQKIDYEANRLGGPAVAETPSKKRARR